MELHQREMLGVNYTVKMGRENLHCTVGKPANLNKPGKYSRRQKKYFN